MKGHASKCALQYLGLLVLGIFAGFLWGTVTKHILSPCNKNGIIGLPTSYGSDWFNSQHVEKKTKKEDIVFIGIMTARKFLNSRVIAAQETWVENIPGTVQYFSSYGSADDVKDRTDIPVIAIPGVDDSYPPQKKSFLLLKYMYENFGDRYEWFMRADDDCYIKGEKLVPFLNSLNSTKKQFVGLPGFGESDDPLLLKDDENFCQGGLGVIFSRATLKALVPHISYCLKNLYTTHEDVEIGRCVRNIVGLDCSWNYEMRDIMYQNKMDPKQAFNHTLKMTAIHQAVSLHPIKVPNYQYRLHIYFKGRKIWELRNKVQHLRQQVGESQKILAKLVGQKNVTLDPLSMGPSLMKSIPDSRKEVLDWAFFIRHFYEHTNSNPKYGLDVNFKNALEDIKMQLMEESHAMDRKAGRTMELKEILYGYKRVTPLHGADYILDLKLIFRKHKGKKLTRSVRQHLYVQQIFQDIEWMEVENDIGGDVSVQTLEPSFFQGIWNPGSHHEKVYRQEKKIHFILPLSGRWSIFLNFMKNFEDVCFKPGENIALVIQLTHAKVDDRTDETIEFIRTFKMKYPHYDIRLIMMEGDFTRAIALQQGAQLYSMDSLIFYVDVDINLTRGLLQRIRLNTIQGKTVFYPIMFSQFSPPIVCAPMTECDISEDPFNYANIGGYWRQFAFGELAFYRSDFEAVGGFDLTIKGWGKEDGDLYNKFVKYKPIDIVRAADPGLTHIFHPILCDPSLEKEQYDMCIGTKSQTYGAVQSWSRYLYKHPELLNRNM